jgi:EAL domain-containing protein (putative c-di-GMP-specific phosphodiesterase class I)
VDFSGDANQTMIDNKGASLYFNREFQLRYQPISDLNDHTLYGFQTLICWRENREKLYASDGLALVEDSLLDLSFNQWALYEACQQMKSWQMQYLNNIPVCLRINLLVKQLRLPDLTNSITQLLDEIELLPEHLQLGISASWITQNQILARSIIIQLRKLGISTYVNDLDPLEPDHNSWQGLPIKALTIRDINTYLTAQWSQLEASLQAIVKTSAKHQIKVIFSGVNTSEQLVKVTALGGGYGQGESVSKPLFQRQAMMLISLKATRQPKELITYLVLMNIVSQCAEKLLGRGLVVRYWHETKPQKPWLVLLQPYKDRKLILSSTPLKKLKPQQQQELQHWLQQFIKRCSRVISNFPDLLDQADLTLVDKRLLKVLCPILPLK